MTTDEGVDPEENRRNRLVGVEVLEASVLSVGADPKRLADFLRGVGDVATAGVALWSNVMTPVVVSRLDLGSLRQ